MRCRGREGFCKLSLTAGMSSHHCSQTCSPHTASDRQSWSISHHRVIPVFPLESHYAFCSRLKCKAQAGPRSRTLFISQGILLADLRPIRTRAACQASLPPSLARLPEQAGLSLKLQKHIGALAGMGFCCPSGLHPPRCGQFHSFLLGAASPQRKKPLEPFSFQPVFIEFHLHVFFFSNRSVIYLGL